MSHFMRALGLYNRAMDHQRKLRRRQAEYKIALFCLKNTLENFSIKSNETKHENLDSIVDVKLKINASFTAMNIEKKLYITLLKEISAFMKKLDPIQDNDALQVIWCIPSL